MGSKRVIPLSFASFSESVERHSARQKAGLVSVSKLSQNRPPTVYNLFSNIRWFLGSKRVTFGGFWVASG